MARVYQGSKAEFLKYNYGYRFTEEVKQSLGASCYVSKAEEKSWDVSYEKIWKLLNTSAIPDNITVVAEYKLGVGSFRIDYLLTGYDKEKQPVAIIIELKQWSDNRIELSPVYPDLVHVKSYGENGLSVHPSYQAWSYKIMLENYNKNVQNEHIALSPCAYLFNYAPKGKDILKGPEFSQVLEEAELYEQKDVDKLQQKIIDTLYTGDNFEVYRTIDQSEIRPSEALQNKVRDMLEGNASFVLVNYQQVVYKKAYQMVRDGMMNLKKKVYIVHGGPGTGKSVIAIRLMTDLLINGIPTADFRIATKIATHDYKYTDHRSGKTTALYCPYVTKTKAPREVYQAILSQHSATGNKWTKRELAGLFIGSGSFRRLPDAPVYAGLIIDEAHRMKASDRFSANTVYLENVLASAYTSIFFVDDRQRISTEDFGSTDKIREYAIKHGYAVEEDTLVDEFRCAGNAGYLEWLESWLYNDPLHTPHFSSPAFDCRVFDDPGQMHEAINAKDASMRGRPDYVASHMVAGYCWDWVSQKNSELDDIIIPREGKSDYHKQWNLNSKVPFAIGESQEEIGCIHTSQGLEFEYVGVIIGPDMRYENGKIITDSKERAKTDNTCNNRNVVGRETVDQIIRNTYYVLLTRGQKGCYIYCTDKTLASYLKSLLGQF